MARSITINSITSTGDGRVNISFTMAGLAIGAMNRTYVLNGLPVDTKYSLFTSIKSYLQDHAAGLQAQQTPAQGAAVTSLVGTTVDVDQALTPGT